MMEIKEWMKNDMVMKLASLLIEDQKAVDVPSALATVMNSETYERLIDEQTGLYYQSPRYVYDYLKNELLLGKVT